MSLLYFEPNHLKELNERHFFSDLALPKAKEKHIIHRHLVILPWPHARCGRTLGGYECYEWSSPRNPEKNHPKMASSSTSTTEGDDAGRSSSSSSTSNIPSQQLSQKRVKRQSFDYLFKLLLLGDSGTCGRRSNVPLATTKRKGIFERRLD